MLSPGATLGPYEILSPIGSGGMGDVYKARDTRLDRIVAIKVSAEQFSERFEREARAVAALNHPNICTLYDVGPNYLVMEYIEGEPLKGPVPVAQAVQQGSQILDALDAAHRKGIVHRDLKPANVLATRAGIKLLDFGLAKQQEKPGASAEETVTLHLTAAHTIVGTPQYMAPEQIEGRDADARTDIFAFGCVLYELLTGRKAFEGKSPSTAMAAVLATEPPSISSVQPDAVPPPLERVVFTCLAKDPDNRWQSAREVKHALEWAMTTPASSPAPAAQSRQHWLPWAIAAILALALPAAWFLRPKPPAPQAVQLDLAAPEGASFTSSNLYRYAISPDGTRLAMVLATPDGKRGLWVRNLDSATAVRLPGTDNSSGPIWAPDNRWLAFGASGKLWKIDTAGGSPQTLCDAPGNPTGSWNRDGVILFGGFTGPVQRISANGGTPSPVLQLDKARNETGQADPEFLPDGRHFLFFSSAKERGIAIGSLDGTSRFLMPHSDSPASYAPSRDGHGFMLFVNAGQLTARPFDPDKGVFLGDAAVIAQDVSAGPSWSASNNGVMVFRHGRGSNAQLTWFDRQGKLSGTLGEPATIYTPRISPDQKTIVYSKNDGSKSDIWIFDLARGNSTRFTFDDANLYPVWSPDGSAVGYQTRHAGKRTVVSRPASGVGNETLLYAGPRYPTQWSRDGRWLVTSIGTGDSTLTLIPLPSGPSDSRKETKFPPTAYDDRDGAISSDGRWFLYSSNQTGRREVFVQSMPDSPGGGKWQISVAGGGQPAWSPNGKEIFFVTPAGDLMSVPIESGPSILKPGVPKLLFHTRLEFDDIHRIYDVTADGNRFLLANPVAERSTVPVTVILNWPALVNK